MNNKYLCPTCRGQLEVEEHIVLTGKAIDGKRGLIFLSPYLGDYKVVKHPNFTYQMGDVMELFCPICNDNLTNSSPHINFAHIILVDQDKVEHEILFSRIAGEHCTYKFTDGKVEKFGDCNSYIISSTGEIKRKI